MVNFPAEHAHASWAEWKLGQFPDKGIRYPMVICWDEKQETLIADAPDLPTGTGSRATYEEALASVLEALHWWQERTHRTRHARHSRLTPKIFSPTRESDWSRTASSHAQHQ